MCFMLFAFIHLLDVGNFHKSHPVIFYWARRRNFDAATSRPSPVAIKRVAYQLCPVAV